jgi:hypothetical protein
MLAKRQPHAARTLAFLITVAALLAGCGGGGAPIVGNSGTSAATGTTTPPTSTPQNIKLTLSGSPATHVVAGSAYVFQPSASENAGTVTFSITGQPSWATFNAATGELSGTPTSADLGQSAAITIVADDSGTTASIGPFSIDVTAAVVDPPPPTGSASLSWVAPIDNTNGTLLNQLAGYHIHYGTSANALTQSIDVSGTSTTTYVISNLAAGTYYFAVSAYTAQGTESALSDVASKTI